MRSLLAGFVTAKRAADEAPRTVPAAEGAMDSFAFVQRQAAVPGYDDVARGNVTSGVYIVAFMRQAARWPTR